MDDTQADRAQAQLRAGVYGRLSETYDAAESVPTQLDRGAGHARRRGWTVVATFKDDGFSAFKEITRDGFGELIAAIEAGAVDVVIVRDIDRLTRNLTDWNAFEKACVRHGVRLSRVYRRGPGPVHGRGRVLRRDGDAAGAAGKRGQERPGPRGPGPGGAQGPADRRGPAVVRVHPDLRQPGRAEPQEAAHRAGGDQPGRGRGDPGRGDAGAGARGVGRLDRAGLGRARHQAGRGRSSGGRPRSWAC